jgi:hypothetical protein
LVSASRATAGTYTNEGITINLDATRPSATQVIVGVTGVSPTTVVIGLNDLSGHLWAQCGPSAPCGQVVGGFVLTVDSTMPGGAYNLGVLDGVNGASTQINVPAAPSGCTTNCGPPPSCPPDCPPPCCLSLSSVKGHADDRIHIFGQHLAGGSADVDGIGVTPMNATDTGIDIVMPPHALGYATIEVVTAYGHTKTPFLYGDAPTVTSVSPSVGLTAGGWTVQAAGANLTSATGVSIGGSGYAVQHMSDSLITFRTPSHAAGNVSGYVFDRFDDKSWFTITYMNPPSVFFSGSTRSADGSAVVTLYGLRLSSVNDVELDAGSTALHASPHIVNDSSLTFNPPAYSCPPPSPCAFSIIVRNPVGASPTVSGATYSYIPKPVVQSISPSSGPVTGGTWVTVHFWDYYDTILGVYFGTKPAVAYIPGSQPHTLLALAPPGVGTADVFLWAVDAGWSNPTGADQFSYVLPAPSVTSLTPSSGGANTVVQISGSGFTGATAVYFGTAAGTAMRVNSDTSITVTAPQQAYGTYDVKVVGQYATSVIVAGDKFTYVKPVWVTLAPYFVDQYHRGLLGAPASSSEMSYWLRQVNGSGYSASQVTNGLTQSDWWARNWVTALYQHALHRAPTATELTTNANAIDSGTRVETIAWNTYGSAEYDALHGSTLKSYVDALYLDLLGRPATTSDETFWSNYATTNGRTATAQLIGTSPEARAVLINGLYQQFDGRSATTSELNFLTTLVNGPVTEEQVAGFVAALPETQLRMFRAYFTEVYHDVLNQPLSDTDFAQYLSELNSGYSLATITQGIGNNLYGYAAQANIWAQAYFHRAATYAEIAQWTGGDPLVHRADMLGTAEYYADNGSTNASWVNAMFTALLGRAPTASEVSALLAQLTGGASRSTVAHGVETTSTYTSAMHAVVATTWLQHLLGTTPTQSDIQAVVVNDANWNTSFSALVSFISYQTK